MTIGPQSRRSADSVESKRLRMPVVNSADGVSADAAGTWSSLDGAASECVWAYSSERISERTLSDWSIGGTLSDPRAADEAVSRTSPEVI